VSATVSLPTDTVLVGSLVRLEPLTPAHLPALLEIAFSNPDEFRLTSTPTTEAEAEKYFGAVLAQRAAGRRTRVWRRCSRRHRHRAP